MVVNFMTSRGVVFGDQLDKIMVKKVAFETRFCFSIDRKQRVSILLETAKVGIDHHTHLPTQPCIQGLLGRDSACSGVHGPQIPGSSHRQMQAAEGAWN